MTDNNDGYQVEVRDLEKRTIIVTLTAHAENEAKAAAEALKQAYPEAQVTFQSDCKDALLLGRKKRWVDVHTQRMEDLFPIGVADGCQPAFEILALARRGEELMQVARFAEQEMMVLTDEASFICRSLPDSH